MARGWEGAGNAILSSSFSSSFPPFHSPSFPSPFLLPFLSLLFSVTQTFPLPFLFSLSPLKGEKPSFKILLLGEGIGEANEANRPYQKWFGAAWRWWWASGHWQVKGQDVVLYKSMGVEKTAQERGTWGQRWLHMAGVGPGKGDGISSGQR